MSAIALPVDDSAERTIPKTLHQIWVGSPPPERVRRNWAVWDAFMAEHHPDWTVYRWTDDSLLSQFVDPTLSPRSRADFMRLVALSMQGGIYADSDTLPLLPLDGLVGDRSDWIASYPESVGRSMLNNATMGFRPRSRFIADVWERALEQVARGLKSDHHTAGPATYWNVWNASGPDRPEIFWDWVNTDAPEFAGRMRRGEPLDLDRLRAAFPGVPIVHITFYGGWA